MAKTATEAPGTSGSQFFVVTGDDTGLPPEYAVIGKVTEGLDVVRQDRQARRRGDRGADAGRRDREDAPRDAAEPSTQCHLASGARFEASP